MLTPVGEHELLLFWLQLVVLLAAARGLGGLMRRFGQPAVVGELGAGLILGPSFFGKVAPGLAAELFPGGEVESALILAVAWLGIVLLLMVTGFETDLRLLRDLGRKSAGVTVGSLLVPLMAGFALGMVLPETYIGEQGDRVVFASFMAVALSISALPVVAKILQDLRLMRRDFGQITVAAGMVNDLVGWLLLGTLIALVHTGGFELGALTTTVLAVVVFVGGSLTVGQRGVDLALRRARQSGDGFAGPFTVTVLVVLVAGSITHALGMEAVIGAFIAGIVVGRSRYQRHEVREALENVTHTIFAPVFFATAGLYVDLTSLFSLRNALAAAAVLAVAAATKLVGSYLGGRVSGLSRLESLATGIGLNARGAMEIVLAAIGLRLGVLNDGSYTAIVLMALATSMAAPPLLRPVLARLEARPEEARRLEREELLAASIIINVRSTLLPTRGGRNSVLAGRILDLILQPDAHVTVLTVHRPTETVDPDRILAVKESFEQHSVEAREQVTERDAADMIVHEATLGYDLVAVGLNEEFRGTHQLSDNLQRLIAGSPVPILLVRRPTVPSDAEELAHLSFRRVLVPVTGTQSGLAAEEVAYVIASRVDAEVDAVHVLAGSAIDGVPEPVQTQMRRARRLAQRYGPTLTPVLRRGSVPYEELLASARSRRADLIVLAAEVRAHAGRPYLGHGTEYLLEHADQTVAVVVFPSEADVPVDD